MVFVSNPSDIMYVCFAPVLVLLSIYNLYHTHIEAVECDRGESTTETAASQCDSSSSSDSICVYNTLDHYQADYCNTNTAARGDDCINTCKYSSALVTADLKLLRSSVSDKKSAIRCIISWWCKV